jgi:hypothetical protein
LVLEVFVSSPVLLACGSVLEFPSSGTEALLPEGLRSFIESQRLKFIFDVALEGINRSEVPISDDARTVTRRLDVGVLLALKLPLELSSLVLGKKCCLGDMCKGLGQEVGVKAFTTGVGRKMEGSRVIPGGGTNLPGADAAEEAEEGANGGVDVFAWYVEIGDGIASLFAYRLSSLDREGDGKATLTERLEHPEEEPSER